MANLTTIQGFAQQVAEAIAAAIKIDITILDENLLRIAGTGRYRREIGKKITPTAAFARVLQTGKAGMIFNPTVNEECQACELKNSCSEIAHIALPITVNKEVKGILAMIAFDTDQRLRLIKQKDEYGNFLAKMTELISSKLLEQQKQMEILEATTRLQGIVDAFTDGVIFIDANRKIISCNPAATRIAGLGEEEIEPGHPLLETLQTGQEFVDREVVREKGGITRRYFCSTRAVYHNQKIIGAIAFLKDYETIWQILNEAGGNNYHFNIDDILGDHPLIQQAKEMAKKASLTDSTVLIQGESGTGKELFARGIHGLSRRKNGPFVAINCAAIPDTLLESELFGYEGGAFTGAKSKGKPGKFELASNGTIFLDEVGDMPLSLQGKLLRVLEERKITRLGGIKPAVLNVRVIAATNKNLEEMVSRKEFREDLFYRLNVIPLKLPPLRERKSDIVLLANFFLEKYKRMYDKEVKGFAPGVLDILQQYDWPGNIRELQNAIEYALNMASEAIIKEGNLPEKILAAYNRSLQKSGSGDIGDSQTLLPLKEVEKILIQRGLALYGNTDRAKVEIARRLGISRASIYRKLKMYGRK